MQNVGEKRMRTCIACGNSAQKGELYRIVREKSGAVAFDATGRAPGRGAYVCSQACLDKAIRQNRVQRALRCGLSQGDEGQLREGLAAALATSGVR